MSKNFSNLCFAVLPGVVSLLLLAGCASSDKRAATRQSVTAHVGRNEAYGLLYDLVSSEKDLSKILFIKNTNDDFDKLIKEISKISETATDKLKDFAKADPTLDIKHTGLPESEVATRKAIANTVTKQLLTSGGRDFQAKLLLTQAEALKYMSHLAGVTAARDDDAARKAYLTDLEATSRNLYDRVIGEIVQTYKGPAK